MTPGYIELAKRRWHVAHPLLDNGSDFFLVVTVDDVDGSEILRSPPGMYT